MSVLQKMFLAGLCLLVLPVFGCDPKPGPKLVPAGGLVSFKGEPVPGASVSLVFADKNVATGTTDSEGKFELFTNQRKGVPVGRAKICVKKVSGSYIAGGTQGMSPKVMVRLMQNNKTAEAMKAGPGSAVRDELPSKYGNPDTSDLAVDIGEQGITDMALRLVE